MSYIEHCFMPGHTIEAIIRRAAGRHLSKTEVLHLVDVFNAINDHPVVRPGSIYRIPTSLPPDGEGSDLD